MLIASCLALALALACSALSRSALIWCSILAFGLVGGNLLGRSGLHAYLCVLDTALLLLMLGNRQGLNREWQGPVTMLQILILGVYIVYSALWGNLLWLTSPFIDAANGAFLIQLSLVALGGLMNSRRNYHYAKALKRNGNTSPFLTLAWRET